MNRYSDYTPSAYDPMDFKDIAMVPMMKRQQHDANQAKLDAYLTEINKIDPYDKHYDEAIKIKSDLANKINQQSEQLAKEGFNNNTVPNILKTNREIQDLYSPTGKAGQINAEKQNILKLNDEYQKLGKEKGWSQETVQNHINNALKDYNNTPIYDDKGRILKYSGPEDMSNKIDYNKYLNELATNAKMSTTEFANAISGLSKDEKSGYSVVNKNSYSHKLGDNYKAVKAAYDTLKLSMEDPTSEVYKSMKYEGRDPKSLLNILNTQSGVYKQSLKADETSSDINPFGSGNSDSSSKEEMFNDAIQDPSSIQNLDKDIHEIDFSTIGTSKFEGSLEGTNTYNLSQKDLGEKHSRIGGDSNTYKSVLNPLQQRFYEIASERLITNGKLPKNANLNDPKNAKIIGFYLKNHMKFPTVANDIIRADVAIDNKLFTGSLASKDQNSRNATLEQDLRSDGNSAPLRTMVDVKTGKKIELEEGDKVDYLGVDSPINYRNYNFNNNKAQSVMAHRAHVLDKDGNVKANVVISRSPNEMNDQNFKNMYDINQIYKNAIEHLGEWRKPSGKFSGNKNINKISIKVNDDNTIQIKRDDSQYPSRPLNNEEFLLQMDRIMNQ